MPDVEDRSPGKPEIIRKRLFAQEKVRRAMAMREAGVTYQVIAEQVGYASAEGAYAAIKKALAKIPREAANEMIMQDTERLNRLLMINWQKAMDPEDEDHFRATEVVMRCMQELRILHGAQGLPGTGNTVNVNFGPEVLMIQGDHDEYVAGLKKAAQALGLPQNITNDDMKFNHRVHVLEAVSTEVGEEDDDELQDT